MDLRIREAEVGDAAQLLGLYHRLDRETRFMLLEPGERTTSVNEQEGILKSFAASNTKTLFLACEEDEILGFVAGVGSTANRNRHSLHCVIGVMQSASGKGIGTRLLIALEGWAEEQGFSRMELTVMRHNERAKRLYLSQGFEIEGIRKRSLLVDGEYVDEYYMAKMLGI